MVMVLILIESICTIAWALFLVSGVAPWYVDILATVALFFVGYARPRIESRFR